MRSENNLGCCYLKKATTWLVITYVFRNDVVTDGVVTSVMVADTQYFQLVTVRIGRHGMRLY